MINQKYYNDIKNFPSQFAKGFEIAKELKISGNFNKVMICGMGGSSSFTALLNDLLGMDDSINFKIDIVRGYDLPLHVNKETLYFIVSYSGNTEETLSCLEEVQQKGLSYIVVTSGGQLEEKANEYGVPVFKVPSGIQPRLSTGYFIAGLLQIMFNCQLIPDMSKLVLDATSQIEALFDEKVSQDLAQSLANSVPIIYSTDNNSSLAYLSKIKFNENSKIQAFWNYFPELNHNEMVGFTNLIMKPFFIIFKSQFTHPRNHKRIEVFSQVMSKQNVNIFIFDLKGKNTLEEILFGYYFIDHVTYYLAENYGIDPEPVKMVEDFKALMNG